jgi:hypothetical protein
MKSILIFLLGGVLGAVCFHAYEQRQDSLAGVSGTARDRTGSTADEFKSSVNDRLVEWHLTGDDIKADLDHTGQVFRANAQVAGDRISDARIAAVIKAKFVLDRDISVFDISVDSTNGNVVLTGSVRTPEALGRAVGLALDSDGVKNVTSRLQVSPTPR